MGHAPSKTRGGHGEATQRLLVLEVLGGWVRDSSWRLGDWWTKGVLGQVRPYAVVSFGDQTERTKTLKVALGARNGCAAHFDRRFVFSLDSRPDLEEVHVAVYDERTMQSVLRGDPLVGHTTVTLKKDDVGTLVRERVDLKREGMEESSGWLKVQYRIMEREVAGRILLTSGDHALAKVIRAIADVLRAPDGLQQVLDARPTVVVTPSSLFVDREGDARRKLSSLMDDLFSQADAIQDESDEEILQRLAPLSRGILTFVAESGGAEESEPLEVAMQWMRTFITKCAEAAAGPDETPTHLNQERLRRFFTYAQMDAGCLVPVDKFGHDVNVPLRWRPGMMVPVKAILGSGAYGCVWRARDSATRQVYAVKRLDLSGIKAQDVVTMRDCEVAEVLCSKTHPNVVRLLCVCKHEDLRSCSLVMEFCSGGDLQDRIQLARSRPGGFQPPARALEHVGMIISGLEHLHLTVGMLVRDVKPQNVVLTKGGCCAKLTDFGMSRLDTTSDGKFSFGPNVPPGSPHYVAPEVIEGNFYDHHADLYSFGVLVWVLLTGGVLNNPVPVPPCAHFDPRRGHPGLLTLTRNWKLLKACVQNPEANRARPLPSAAAVDFVLQLTNREEGHLWLDHADVRAHPLLEGLGG
mmetsp:Transcript_21032/g.66443  ORF Transcript_21032/g.66443 Transcript_21032/m.66443 type:complete len:635 (+) Transcript_21032:95-1999(+)